MKRNLLWIIVSLSIALALTSTAPAQPPDQAGARGPAGAERTAALQQQRQIQQIDEQIAALRTEHQELLGQLRTLHQTAIDEGATKTAATVERLINSRQQTFQEKVGQLQRTRQRLQIASRERAATDERPERRARSAPDFTLDSFDGRSFSLADLRGKIVVLEWMNMECPFSKYHYETERTMVGLAEKYRDKNVVWLAVNSTNHTTAEANLAAAKEYKVPYPILDDRSGRVGRLYGARTTPHMFIIDPQGRLVYNGAIDSAPMGRVQEGSEPVNYVDQALAELTSGRPVSTATTQPYGCTVKYPGS